MTSHRHTPQPGEVRQFDRQADIYGARYRLVERLTGNTWLCEHLEPTDDEMDAIMNDPSPYAGGGVYILADGTAVFPNTPEETVLARIDQAGATFKMRLVSRAEYDRAF